MAIVSKKHIIVGVLLVIIFLIGLLVGNTLELAAVAEGKIDFLGSNTPSLLESFWPFQFFYKELLFF